MAEPSPEIEFEDIDRVLDRFVEVWENDGYEQGGESPVGYETWKWEALLKSSDANSFEKLC